MVKVGNPGDVGVAQFSDMLFTVADVVQGKLTLCKQIESRLRS
jgi:glucan 1,3-beta-glucosidase